MELALCGCSEGSNFLWFHGPDGLRVKPADIVRSDYRSGTAIMHSLQCRRLSSRAVGAHVSAELLHCLCCGKANVGPIFFCPIFFGGAIPTEEPRLALKALRFSSVFFLRPHQADLFIRRAGNLHLYNIVARNAAVPNIRIESIYRINDWSDLDIAKQSLGTFVEQIHYVGVWCDVEFFEDSFSENCHTDIEAIRHSGHVTGFDLLVLSTPPIAIVSFFSEARCDKQRRSAQQEKESFHIHCPVG
jgi:hypothetical protein